MIHPQAITIRGKKLGVLIKDARLSAKKTKKQCAAAIGTTSSTFGSYERGVKSPSLPELEVLAFFLNIPVDHFYGKEAISDDEPPTSSLNLENMLALRQRIIGALLRQARTDLSLSMKDLASRAGLTSGRLKKFELGERPIPIPELEALVSTLGISLDDFRDGQSPVGDWILEQRAVHEFLKLSPELQNFVCTPVNRPYLKIAQNLSEMSVEKLRSVAEGLLEITL